MVESTPPPKAQSQKKISSNQFRHPLNKALNDSGSKITVNLKSSVLKDSLKRNSKPKSNSQKKYSGSQLQLDIHRRENKSVSASSHQSQKCGKKPKYILNTIKSKALKLNSNHHSCANGSMSKTLKKEDFSQLNKTTVTKSTSTLKKGKSSKKFDFTQTVQHSSYFSPLQDDSLASQTRIQPSQHKAESSFQKKLQISKHNLEKEAGSFKKTLGKQQQLEFDKIQNQYRFIIKTLSRQIENLNERKSSTRTVLKVNHENPRNINADCSQKVNVNCQKKYQGSKNSPSQKQDSAEQSCLSREDLPAKPEKPSNRNKAFNLGLNLKDLKKESLGVKEYQEEFMEGYQFFSESWKRDIRCQSGGIKQTK